jgi:hypothetical protein
MEKQINAKAMGLFAKGYLTLFSVTGDNCYKRKAEECLQWLLDNPSPGYHGFCWGYPFDWRSKILIPRNTPSGVVSSVVGDAFWAAYKILHENRFLDVCLSICRFFLSELHIDEIDKGCICFSYTPLDDFHVHNANLFVSEFLVRVGSESGREDFARQGRLASQYALREQNTDGSLYYWGRKQNHYNPCRIDHYHSGFEMRMLYGLWKTTRDKDYFQALERYYDFYLKHLIAETGDDLLPKWTPRNLFPVNIHTCAEAILCNAVLSESFTEPSLLLPRLCRWIIRRMQKKEGWFRYRFLKTPIGLYPNNIPYIRWGQAWMLLALSTCLSTLECPQQLDRHQPDKGLFPRDKNDPCASG